MIILKDRTYENLLSKLNIYKSLYIKHKTLYKIGEEILLRVIRDIDYLVKLTRQEMILNCRESMEK